MSSESKMAFRSAVLGGALVAWLLLLGAGPSHATLRVLRSDATALELEWTQESLDLVEMPGSGAALVARAPRIAGAAGRPESGAPDLPFLVELVGLPYESEPRVRVVSVTVGRERVPDLARVPYEEVVFDPDGSARVELTLARPPGAPLPGRAADRWADVPTSGIIRGQRVGHLEIHPFRWDEATGELQWARRLVLRLEYGPEGARSQPGGAAPSADGSELLATRLLNGNVAGRWRRARPAAEPRAAAGGGYSFAESSNWVKFPIDGAGIYRVDYSTFQSMGYDPAGIDPNSIRVFSGTNLELEESLVTDPRPFMTECALLDLGDGQGGLGQFDLQDRFLFYALGTKGWGSEYDPALPRTEHVDHWYTDQSYYWLTWSGAARGDEKRMSIRSVVPQDPPPASGFKRSAPHRIHLEQNNVDDFRYRHEDGWVWEDLNGRGVNRLYEIDVERPAASRAGFLQARMYSYEKSAADPYRAVELRIGQDPITRWIWRHRSGNAQFDVTGCFEGLLVNGRNEIRVGVDLGIPQTRDHVFTGWFDLEYDRELVARGGNTLKFFSAASPPILPTHVFADSISNPDEPVTTVIHCDPPPALLYGNDHWTLQGFDAAPSEIFLFDVSDQHDVVRLDYGAPNGAAAPYNIRFSDPGGSGGATTWYYATTLAGVKRLPTGEAVVHRDLRQITHARYLIIYHPSLAEGANRLAAIRSALGEESLTTMAVSIQEVYDQFSWGLKDPTAIRDYLWTVTDTPSFVVLLGDAAFDTKGFQSGSPENMVPTYSKRYRTISLDYAGSENTKFYSTDDYFGYLDAGDYTGSLPGLDAAIGRYPVRTPEQLDGMLDKLEVYLSYAMAGQWQNRVILVADDEMILDDQQREPWHTQQVEVLATGLFPPALDRVKIYLTEYARNDFGKKPEAQKDFIEEFTRGALMTTYTGHGDAATMSQEEVFVSQKIPDLLNENRYTVFSTFSCTVSRYDLLSGDSMAELLLFYDRGGAVTTFASGGLVYPNPSSDLNQEWLSAMYGTPYLIPTYSRYVRPIGEAALLAKFLVRQNVENNEKYVLLGDPALRVRFGTKLVEFDSLTVDTQFVGAGADSLLRVVRGTVRDEYGEVLDGTHGFPAFNGTAFVHVTEGADDGGYDYLTPSGAPQHIDYVLEGVTTYRGEVPVTAGRFQVAFYLSQGVVPGNRGRISVFALSEGSTVDASGAYDSLQIAPTITPEQVDDTEGPAITVRFEGYDQFIDGDFLFTDTPVLDVDFEDPSGVNLRPFPQFARLEAEIDDRERIELGDDFSYLNGSVTHGRVRRILSLAPGAHRLAIKAFDNVGNRSSLAVNFTIVLPENSFDLVDDYTAVYPNPFRENVDFLFRLTHGADVTLKVFTIAGRKVYQTEETFYAGGTGPGAGSGDKRIRWDGRDDNGRPLANGTYLYKLEAVNLDSEGRKRSDEIVGHVVRMR